MEHASEGMLLLTDTGTILYASPAAYGILGYKEGELAGVQVPNLAHPDDREMLQGILAAVSASPDLRMNVPPSRFGLQEEPCRWIESVMTNKLHDPLAGGIIWTLRDTTKEKQVHESLVYANRLYDFLRHIHHAIVHAKEEDVLFDEACRIAVTHGGFRYAWIGIPDRETRKVLMAASAGGTTLDSDFFSDYAYDYGGPIEHVLEGSPNFVVDHIQSRSNKKFIAYANDRGFQSAIVLPLKKEGQVFAVLNLYAAGKSFFDAAEIALLAEASADLSFALDVLERDTQRTIAVKTLQQKELRLSLAQKIANIGSWEHDLATGKSNWSEQAMRIYGLDPGQECPTYNEWIGYVHPKDRNRIAETMAEAGKDCLDCTLYHRIVRPDGSIRHVHTQSHFEFDEAGIPKVVIGIVHDVTDMRIQQQALQASEDAFRESEFRYKQIVENAHEGILLLNRKNRTLFANGKMCQILEYAPEMIEGKKFRSLIAEDESDADLGKPEAYDALVRFKTSTGRLVWTHVAFGPVMENGRLALVSDITEKRELEELLDNATTMARIGGYELDLESNSMFWSPMTRDIHEVDESFSPTLEKAMAFYKTESRDILSEAGYKALKQGTPWDLELQIVTAKGNERWVRVIGRPEHSKGRCVKIYGSFQDIDSRKNAELEVLNIAEEKNRILESIGNAFFAVDNQWNVTYWNKEAERLLDRKRHDVIGKNLWELYPETIGTDYFHYYHKAVQENTVQQFESVYEPMQMWTEVSAYPSPAGLSVYFKDITERKRAETERAGMMTEIIRRNQDLEQFSYIVSHNLRGPVANIMGIASELENEGHTADTKRFLKKSLSVSARRLDEVIIDLNGILKLQKDVTENREPICLHWLVDGIRDSIIDLVRAENVTITTDFTAIGEMTSIKSYLYSIFYNLIINSIKYRQEQQDPIIEIRSSLQDGRVQITFTDNGMGIDLETKREQVFGLYKRFHNHVEGKGLGLFMVKTQVQMLGGSIEIASKIGAGTTITLDLAP